MPHSDFGYPHHWHCALLAHPVHHTPQWFWLPTPLTLCLCDVILCEYWDGSQRFPNNSWWWCPIHSVWCVHWRTVIFSWALHTLTLQFWLPTPLTQCPCDVILYTQLNHSHQSEWCEWLGCLRLTNQMNHTHHTHVLVMWCIDTSDGMCYNLQSTVEVRLTPYQYHPHSCLRQDTWWHTSAGSYAIGLYSTSWSCCCLGALHGIWLPHSLIPF